MSPAPKSLSALLLAAGLFLGLSSPLTPVCQAQAGPGQANRLFEEGIRLYDAGRFAEAAAKFEELVQLAPDPAACFNLAFARVGLGHQVEARLGLREMLDGQCGVLSADERDQVRSQLESAESRVANVAVQIQGAERATISIDGQHQREVTGSRGELFDLNPGEHILRVTSPERTTVERRISLSPGQRESLVLELLPDREPGTLILSSEDPTAVLEIVGVDTGVGVLRRELDPGTYSVEARADGATIESEVSVSPGRTVRLQLDAPGESIFQNPWFWAVSGASAVLVAAGAIALGLALTTDSDPVTSDVWGPQGPLRGSP